MPPSRFQRKRAKFARKFKPRGLSKAQKQQVVHIARRIDNKSKDLKFAQYDFTTTQNTTWTGPVSFILHPAQSVAGYGTILDLANSQSGRIANEIEVVHIQWNFQIIGADSSNVFRIIIFQWMVDNSQDQPAVGDIVMGTGAFFPHLEPLNYQNKAKYRIMYDKTHQLSTAAGNDLTINRHVSFYGKKIPVKKLKYTDNTQNGFGAYMVKGAIYYMLVSDSSVVSHPTINWKVRMLFTDA